MERLGGSCTCNDAWRNWNCTTDGKQMWRCPDGEVEKQECVGGCNVMPVGTPDQCVATAPEGGAGAAGSASGSAGASGVAGAASGGSGGSAVQPEAGGSSGTGGVNASGSSTAGTPVVVAPEPGVATNSAQTDSGCSCFVVGNTRRTTSSTGAALALLLGFGLRRRFRTAAFRQS